MASYNSAKEEIKRAADIVELIGRYVQLRKAGRNYVGLCPFHAEKAPSFTVNPERQTFHCFGCKKGGDIFSFWMEYHSATFPEALKDLAEKYHITISERFSESAEKKKAAQRELLYKINEMATDYYGGTLKDPEKGIHARSYLKRRTVSDEIISEFRLGYAPAEWDGLTRTLRKSGINLDMAVQAGLIIPKKTGGFYDRFRSRIIFPIFDLRQHVVGFGGRVLDNSLPKYLNTPETPLFHKGELFYGLHVSFKAIREKGRAVIVEGYMDCLALKDHGFQEVVATLGTTLTDRHVRKLKGYAKEVFIVFDSDEAGKKAALKSLPVFSNEGLSAKAVLLPDGHDPDSFVNENGLKGFLELLDHASPMFDFYLEQRLTHGDSDEAKIGVLKESLPILSEIHEFSLRSLYIRRLSERIGIKEDVVWLELKSFRDKNSAKTTGANLKERIAGSMVERRFDDLHILNLLIHYPQRVYRLMDCNWKVILYDPVVVDIVETFFQQYHKKEQFLPEDLLDSLESDVARKELREALLEKSHYPDEEVEQALTEIEGKVKQIQIAASIKKAREQGNIEELKQLFKLKAQNMIRE